MAGVRPSDENEDAPIAEPRGFPSDVTKETMLGYERWDGDAHSISWLSRLEMRKLSEWLGVHADEVCAKDRWHGLEAKFGYLFGSTWASFEPGEQGYPPWLEDVRVVFWFDN
jgi:hypothetical protein